MFQTQVWCRSRTLYITVLLSRAEFLIDKKAIGFGAGLNVISGRVCRAFATETVDSGSIPSRLSQWL